MLISYENEAIAAKKKGLAIEYLVPEADDPDRDADRGHEQELAPAQAQRVRQLAVDAGGADDLGAAGLPPRRRVGARAVREQVPDPAADCSRSSRWAAGRRSSKKFFDPKSGLGDQDRAGGGGAHCLQLTQPRRRWRPPVRAARRRDGARRPRARRGDALPERDRADPAGRRRGQGRSAQGPAAFWDSVTNTLALRALAITLGSSLVVAAIGAVMGTLVAWVLVRDEFPGKRIVSALIDLPFALPTIVAGLTLLALYGPQQPVRRPPRLHARRRSCSRCCS